MAHADSLILTLVGGFVLAFVFGMAANRLKLSPLVGYLVAGVVVGPHTAGFVADTELAPQLAEIGVILLMFGVGLHFSPRDLMQVRKVALPGALAQIAAATGMGWALGRFALGMSEEQRAGTLAGNGQHAGLHAAGLALALGVAAWPGDLFGPRAIGKIGTGDLVPDADQRGIDPGLALQHRVDQAIGGLGNLECASALEGGHGFSACRNFVSE